MLPTQSGRLFPYTVRHGLLRVFFSMALSLLTATKTVEQQTATVAKELPPRWLDPCAQSALPSSLPPSDRSEGTILPPEQS